MTDSFGKGFMKSKPLIFIVVGGAILLSGIFSVYLFAGHTQAEPLPVYGEIRDFQLTDSRGENFQSGRLKGKVWVADFFFTTCSTICPVMTRNMNSLYGVYKSSPDVEFVSISVNPEQDTPAVLAKYAEKYQVSTNNWHFLTGAREAITNLTVNSFKIGSIEEPIFHSANFVLVDKSGRIRGYYDGTVQEEVTELAGDLKRLIKEK